MFWALSHIVGSHFAQPNQRDFSPPAIALNSRMLCSDGLLTSSPEGAAAAQAHGRKIKTRMERALKNGTYHRGESPVHKLLERDASRQLERAWSGAFRGL
jgi:hypothetical protein